jgi:hypothetical protein
LGLYHGGGFGILNSAADNRYLHRKPNYVSVMNYARQFNSAGDAAHIPGIPDGKLVRLIRKLDYSRSALPTLLEFSLDEASGVGGPAGERFLYGVDGIRRVGPANGPVDWNSNGTADETGLNLDINYIKGAADSNPKSGESFFGHDDWSRLIFSSRVSSQFGLSLADVGTGASELTAQDYLRECLGRMWNSQDALKFAAGVLRAEQPDLVQLDKVLGASTGHIDLLDAVREARHAAGLDP